MFHANDICVVIADRVVLWWYSFFCCTSVIKSMQAKVVALLNALLFVSVSVSFDFCKVIHNVPAPGGEQGLIITTPYTC